MGHLLGKTDGEKEPSFPLPPSLQRSNFSILTGIFPQLTFNFTKRKKVLVRLGQINSYTQEKLAHSKQKGYFYIWKITYLFLLFFFCPFRKLVNVRDIFSRCFNWMVTCFCTVDDKCNYPLYLLLVYIFLGFTNFVLTDVLEYMRIKMHS